MEYINKILCGNNLEILPKLPVESVNCCVTSPPYWSLRDYGVEGQLGLEKTFEEYITKLCDIFDEVKRVLRKDGTCWVNLGDTYGGSGGDSGKTIGNQRKGAHGIDTRTVGISGIEGNQKLTKGYEKSLLLIPQRFVIEMVNRGWILRNTIIWHKKNCMPSSAKDRFTVDFEYVYFFVKSKKYWFEQQFEEHLTQENRPDGIVRNRTFNYKGKYSAKGGFKGGCSDKNTLTLYNPQGRNKRTVWTIPTQPFPEAHFAVYPEALIEPMIKAGCPRYVCKKCGKARVKIYEIDRSKCKIQKWDELEDKLSKKTGNNLETDLHRRKNISGIFAYSIGAERKEIGYSDCGCNAGFRRGIIFDPFMGAGTTAVVAKKLGRNYLGIEIKQEYIDMANKRIRRIPELLF